MHKLYLDPFHDCQGCRDKPSAAAQNEYYQDVQLFELHYEGLLQWTHGSFDFLHLPCARRRLLFRNVLFFH